ncbi:hypothetical protein Tsubulata_023223 [Turnera subulata]|uniref:Carbohydrate kinase PfkB domain-containing protein n=1 Tax=Turnera subulata TaxID=218843 RepID=A0A9Q0FH80_9ROSI|nr:hypothetical protein Tsubulata_023223 [Turnera subulata]
MSSSSLTFTHLFSLPPRCHVSNCSNFPSFHLVRVQDFSLPNKWAVAATSRKKVAQNLAVEENNDEPTTTTTTTTTTVPVQTKTTRRTGTSKTTRKKPSTRTTSAKKTETKKVPRRKKTQQTNDEDVQDQGSESDISDTEDSSFFSYVATEEEEEEEEETDIDLLLENHGGEDISYTYGLPPLVCCFGAAQSAFVPSGRPANRLIDHEIHERMKDVLWEPEKFVRAPGGCAGSVAVALASLGGKVAFMGKLGDDELGEGLLEYLNESKVRTRSLRIESKRPTALSKMKIARRGRLRAKCTKPCAEDSLSKSEINLDVLKEAKMFYFSTHSMLDKNTRSVALQAVKISKKLGGLVFYDVNLPLPLWKSSEETKQFIQVAWSLADIIEVTKQELEFLCGIKPTEEFDTRNNASSKFPHYEPEVIEPLWHENLKVLFVTNGTSKVHYYTKEHNGAVLGFEDARITPYTGDMSASGDGLVAGLMRMLSDNPESITDKTFLECTVSYAIDCGVIDQMKHARQCGYPAKEGMEVEPDENGIRSITEEAFRTVVSPNRTKVDSKSDSIDDDDDDIIVDEDDDYSFYDDDYIINGARTKVDSKFDSIDDDDDYSINVDDDSIDDE